MSRRKRTRRQKRKAMRRHRRKHAKDLNERLSEIAMYVAGSGSRFQRWYEPTERHLRSATPIRCLICRRIITTRKAKKYARDIFSKTDEVVRHGESHLKIVNAMDQGLVPLPSSQLDQLEVLLGWTPKKNAKERSHKLKRVLTDAGAQVFERVFCAKPYVHDLIVAPIDAWRKLAVLQAIARDMQLREALTAASDINGVPALVEAQFGGGL